MSFVDGRESFRGAGVVQCFIYKHFLDNDAFSASILLSELSRPQVICTLFF